jgi:hypothetical protein
MLAVPPPAGEHFLKYIYLILLLLLLSFSFFDFPGHMRMYWVSYSATYAAAGARPFSQARSTVPPPSYLKSMNSTFFLIFLSIILLLS